MKEHVVGRSSLVVAKTGQKDIVLKNWRELLASDCGSLLDIHVPGTTGRDWQKLLDHLSGVYKAEYSEDGVVRPIPAFEDIWERRQIATQLLRIHMDAYTIACHFFVIDDIEMDLLPDKVNSEEKATSVFAFMTSIASALGKDVFLTPEFGGATEAKLREMAMCAVDSAGTWRLHPTIANDQRRTT